jgi:polysaccharide export outer membrane protein
MIKRELPLISRKIIQLVILTTLLTGCIRYTPSREEIQERARKDGAPAAPLGTEQEFHEYEKHLEQRLNGLLSERAYLLEVSQSLTGYSLGPGDQIEVTVFGFNDLTTITEVSPSGTIHLPLVGETSVAGRDLGMVRTHLSAAYSKFIRNPKVDVAIKNAQANRVSVIGEVSKPGMYPLRRNGQLITELISEAGGRSQLGSNRLILLPAPKIAAGKPHNQALASSTGGVEIEMDALFGKIDTPPVLIPLLAGDTVVVPEAGKYEVDGEVEKPGSYPLSSQASVMSAIASAGGFTYSSDVKKVEVIREIGNGRKALATLDLEEVGLRGGKDIRLRSGDLIRVPSEPGLFFERQVVESLNSLFNGVSVNKPVN